MEQGDIIAPTDDLRVVLKAAHPHFCAEKYVAFTVATQSCDLVRRGSRPLKARYISLAVVRSLKEVLPKLIETVAKPVGQGIFPTSSKFSAKQFLSRVFDQNEQALGLFYLHPDADAGLGEPSVAYLRVAIALRSDHYLTLVRARTGRLDAQFRGKFGWLLGNLYSRAASPDWTDFPGGSEQRQELINRYLAEQISGAGPRWLEDDLIDSARKAGVDFSTIDVHALGDYRPKPRLERIVNTVVAEVARILTPESDDLTKLKNILLNSGSLKKLAK